MIEIEDALQRIADRCVRLPAFETALDQLAGHVLAESVISDVDSPPFSKSMMDGYGVRSADTSAKNTQLKVVGRIQAGQSFDGDVGAGQAVQIMTGAPIPPGADAVVMFEQTSEENDVVTIHEATRSGQNILAKAVAMARGQSVMDANTLVRGEDIGLLAEAGAAICQAVRRPSLAVIATGDELVDASMVPGESQIRNSNGPMIASMAKSLCSAVMDLGIGADDPRSLGAKIEEGLRRDVLVLSGGVSAGVADLVPGLLKDAGVEQVFHKVKIKPGKPVWFGALPKDNGNNTLVFGLPGNPVSSMVCFRVFVAPALLRLSGQDPARLSTTGTLTKDHSQRPGRTTWWPSRLDHQNGLNVVTPLDWKGSADLKTLKDANAFAVFPGEQGEFSSGETVTVFPIGNSSW